jgi:hypothetical protein
VGKTKVGKVMKLEVVVERSGLPLGMQTAAANVSENELLLPALDDMQIEVPSGTPVIADKGHDSDSSRRPGGGGLHARDPAPQESGQAEPQRRAEASPLSASLADRADKRLAALLSRLGRSLVALLVHVCGHGLLGLHAHGVTTVLKLSLSVRALSYGWK